MLLPYHVSKDSQFTDDLHIAGRLAGSHHVVTGHWGLEEAFSGEQRVERLKQADEGNKHKVEGTE